MANLGTHRALIQLIVAVAEASIVFVIDPGVKLQDVLDRCHELELEIALRLPKQAKTHRHFKAVNQTLCRL
jgi:hypothetical protein